MLELIKDSELMCITRIKYYVSLQVFFDSGLGNRVQVMTISSNVFVVLDSTFSSGQSYVALSRVREICPIISASDNPIIVSNNIRSLYGLQPQCCSH